jgi:hypothetical protein
MTTPSERSARPLPLDYATPTPPKRISRRVILVTLGVLSALLSLVMLFFGVIGIVWLLSNWKRVDVVDVLGVVTCNLCFAVCAYASFLYLAAGISSWHRRAVR